MTRRKRRSRRKAGVTVLALVALWAVASPVRWAVWIGVAMAVIASPMLLAGSRSQLAFRTRRRRALQRQGQKGPPVPSWLRKAVYAADRYRCVYCRSVGPLQFDHIKPWSLGFSTSLWNAATLCGPCNRVKSNYWVSDTGQAYYRPFRHAASMGLAGQILRAELRARRNPLRWLRAARTWWF